MIPLFVWPTLTASVLVFIEFNRPGRDWIVTSMIFALGALSGALAVLN